MSEPAPTPTQPRRRRRRRWLLRVPIIVGGLVVTTAVLTQVVLWTDYPRQIAEAQVQNILGVRAQIQSLEIGWFGSTHIRGITLTLPTETDPFITIDSIDATHTALPLIAFSQTLHEANVSGVKVVAKQNTNGNWNVVESLLAPRSPDNPNAQPSNTGQALRQVPDVHVRDVQILLTRADGKTLELSEIEFDWLKREPLKSALSLKVGNAIDANGVVGLVHAVPHELSLNMLRVPDGVADFFSASLPSTLAAKLSWQGQRDGDGIRGTLRVQDFHAEPASVAGDFAIAARPGNVLIQPRELSVKVASAEPIDLEITSGSIRIADAIQLDRLVGTLNGGSFAVGGNVATDTLESNFSITWTGVQRQDLIATGTATLSSRRDPTGLILADSNVKADVVLPEGSLQTWIDVKASGRSIRDLSADLIVGPTTFTRQDQPAVAVPLIKGTLAADDAQVELTQFRFDDPSTEGTLLVYGAYQFAQRGWWLTLDTDSLNVPALRDVGVVKPLTLSVAGTGTLTRADISRLFAKFGDTTAWATGFYDTSDPEPLRLVASLWHERPVTEDGEARLNLLRADAHIDGTLAPLNLKAEADVHGTELSLRGNPLGDVDVHVVARLNPKQAVLRSRDMQVLGGTWWMDGYYLFNSPHPPVVKASFKNLPLENLGSLIDRPELSGTVTDGLAEFRFPSSRLDSIEMDASAAGVDMAFAPVRAETMSLTAALRKGRFDIKPVFKQGDGITTATLSGHVNLVEPFTIDLAIDRWPAAAPTTQSTLTRDATLSAKMKAQISAADLDAVSGHAEIEAKVDRAGNALVSIEVDADLSDKKIQLSRANVRTLNGEVGATGIVDLVTPDRSILDATFDRLRPAALAELYPILDEVNGTFGGTLGIQPSTMARPLGAMQVTLNIQPQNASFRTIEIGDIRILAFADARPDAPLRLVTDDAEIHVAGGVLKPFVRFSRAPGGVIGQIATVQFSDLDLNQITRAIDDDGKPLVGRLAGEARVFGHTRSIAGITGVANVQITGSDLANFGPIAAMYNLLSVGTAGSEPNGSGYVNLSVEAGTVRVEDAQYFNRGLDARAYGAVVGIDNLESARFDNLLVIGSLQPLRAVKLPFFGDVNDTLAALQSSLTAVQVSGSLKDPQIKQVSLNEVGSTVSKILFGK